MARLIQGTPPSRVLRQQSAIGGGVSLAGVEADIAELTKQVGELTERFNAASESFADLGERLEALENAKPKGK